MTSIQNFDTPFGELSYVKLTNASGASVVLSNLGAGIVAVNVPDRNGILADVALGYENPADYLADGPCMGKTAGRFANRIVNGKLTIGDNHYELPINCGPHHLHGGPKGFQNKLWKITEISENSVSFTCQSPDGEMGYPGNISAQIRYEWTESDELKLTFSAQTDTPTVINLTNHTYWNLQGHNSGNALNHELKLYSSRWLETDSTLAPTGILSDVTGTPMDFRISKPVGKDIHESFQALKDGKGYDHCWVVDGELYKVKKVAELCDLISGRCLTVSSDQPGMQLYTGNWLTGSPKGKNSTEYHDYDAIAIECQDFPDAPNHPNFPSSLLTPGQTYCRHINYIFTTIP